MITGISGLGFFGPKMAVSWRISVYQENLAEIPILIVFFGCALFRPSCQEGKFWTPTKKKKMTDNCKAFFWGGGIFGVFFFIFFVFFLEGFRVRWGGPKGPPHLALNPPYSFFFVFFWGFVFFCFCVFFEGLRVRWGGPKGHLTWP